MPDQLEKCLVTFDEVEEPSELMKFISTESLDLLENEPETKFDAILKLAWLDIPNPNDQLMEEIYLKGDLFDIGYLNIGEERARITETYFQNRRTRFDSILPDLADIPGLTVVDHLVGLDLVHVKLSLDTLEQLRSVDFIDKVIVVDPEIVGEDALTGDAGPILQHMQLHDNYFVYQSGAAGDDGEYSMPNSDWTDIVAAVIDNHGMNANHYAFKDTSASGYRVREAWECENTCTEIDPPTDMFYDNDGDSGNWHGTAVAGLLGGDLRDDQDPNYAIQGSQQQRSGQAPECGFIFIDTLTGEAAWYNAINRSVVSQAHIISISNGFPESSSGESTTACAANCAYKSGILTIASTGNDSTNEVHAPADAEGSLAVGSLGDGTEATESDWDSSSISDYSNYGPHRYWWLRYRTVVDLLAPGYVRYFLTDTYDSGAGAYNSGLRSGTSYAQPRAAAALIDALDFMVEDKGDSTILLPGMQKVFMLMMTDRQTNSGGRKVAGFSYNWGAGRSKMRRLDSSGMDGPWGRQNGYVCVGDGEHVDIPIKNGDLISSDVDSVKAVIWWYTDDFSSPIPNDIDLQLVKSTNQLVWQFEQSDTGADLKKMVYSSEMGGYYGKI